MCGFLQGGEKTEDIITRIPPKKVVKKGTGKMSDFTYEKQVEAFGETLDISIRRYADTTLQQTKDESGRAYYDNKVQLVIKRNDGSVFVDRTFAKTDFSEFTNNDYGRHGALLGFMFDTVENGRMKFGASVGSPDPTSDEFIPHRGPDRPTGENLFPECHQPRLGQRRGEVQGTERAGGCRGRGHVILTCHQGVFIFFSVFIS